MPEKLIISAVSAIFGAGVAWGILKQMRRDVTGIGRKMHRIEIVTLMYCPENQREKVGNIFLGR